MFTPRVMSLAQRSLGAKTHILPIGDTMNRFFSQTVPVVSAVCAALTAQGALSQTPSSETSGLEEVVIVSKATTYANNEITDSMKLQNSSITSINNFIDNLPGVSVHEGDAFGFDDWSTAITVRGFQTNLAEQQVGSTIDGLPNGNSNYGGGALSLIHI